MKPQAAALGALVWLAEGRWRQFLPAVPMVALSTLLWPEWLGRVALSTGGALNVSFFPWTLLIAMPLLAVALRRRNIWLAALVTPLATPYIALYSLAPTCAILCHLNWRWGALLAAVGWVAATWVRMNR